MSAALCSAHTGAEVNCLTRCTDNRWIFSGGGDGVIRKYDFYPSLNQEKVTKDKSKSGSRQFEAVELQHWGLPQVSPIYSLACHSEAVWLLAGNQKGELHLCTVRVQEGQWQFMKQTHNGPISGISILPGERACITASWDRNVVKMSLDDGSATLIGGPETGGHQGQITSLSLRRGDEETQLLTTSIDGSSMIWDTRNPNQQPIITMNKDEQGCKISSWAMTADWHHSGEKLYVGWKDGRVFEYDVRNPTVPSRTINVKHVGAISAIVALQDHIVCAPAEDAMRLYDIRADWSKKNPQYTLLPGHHGMVAEIITDDEFRFVVVASGSKGWEGSTTNKWAAYDLTDTLQLEQASNCTLLQVS